MFIENLPLISLGSPLSIGYEIFLRCLTKKIFKKHRPICVGSEINILSFIKILKLKINFFSVDPDNIEKIPYHEKKYDFFLINIDDEKFDIKILESISKLADGYYAYKTIDTASDLINKGFFKSLVTLPVNKKNINMIDKNFFGHTEFFQKKWKQENVYMTFVSKKFIIMLLTTHIPIKNVSDHITPIKINNILDAAVRLKDRLKLKKDICFLGINPHAGEEGLIGKEDNIIKKTIDKYNYEKRTKIIGPIPSDTAFIKSKMEQFDIFIACYHDQGLIPFKMLSFDDGVNFSYGMNIIRTSVDHGTGVSLIGKKKAKLTSFINAYDLALKFS
ncbi:MAG: 4-hydroxythreonine-4-phosphate dehydrogenase PdxA [Spirochaetes bacterium]|nr:4-hydroxythreonine-4-phosphate dehydrogenase PdxA [Spirochaetota bacterium]